MSVISIPTTACLCLLAVFDPIHGQDPLDSLFRGDTAAVIPVASLYRSGSNVDSPSTSFGGTLANLNGYGIHRDVAFGNAGLGENQTFSYMRGDFFLDSRLDKGIKGHVSLSVLHVSDAAQVPYSGTVAAASQGAPSAQTLVQMDEFFLDVSVAQRAYVRAGQQVLKWGQGFFWNPVDLANVDRKDFVEMDRERQGVYGLRLTIPYKTLFNYQLFIDANRVSLPAKYSMVNRVEVLLGPLELAGYLWSQRGRYPIPGFDFSMPIGSWGWYGEGIYRFEPPENAVPDDSLLVNGLKPAPEKGIKILLGTHKHFLRDKLFAGGEAYFNGMGMEASALENARFRDGIKSGTIPYQAFDLDRWYAAFYLQYGELWEKTISLGLNAVVNFSDASALVYPSFTFSHVDNFSLVIKPVIYLGGSPDREMTFQNRYVDILADITLRF